MEFQTTKHTAEKWNISARRVAILCEEARIEGAVKMGKTWLIPIDSQKPDDGRYKRLKAYYEKYKDNEQKYKVVYPDNSNATYTSLLNYSNDLNKPFQRWYRYKEGFSIELVKQLIKEYSKYKSGVILDPFAGSGSTLVASRELEYEGIGYEVNPFSYFLAECKLDNYSVNDIEAFKIEYERILSISEEKNIKYELPELSISSKVFNDDIEKYYMSIGHLIENVDNRKVSQLLRIGWLACLEPLCDYRKAGNGLKYKKYVKPRVVTIHDAKIMLIEEYQNIYIDLLKGIPNGESKLYNKSCVDMSDEIEDESVVGIIFSPPYANCFDYTEIYKLELWFGGFVRKYDDLKALRKASLHSHLNGDLNIEVPSKSEFLGSLLEELETKELWDRKIPRMLKLYYNDMFNVIDECYRVLKKGGFCSIVVGNSAYGGIVFPADLILSEYAEKIGFTVDKIEVDRFIITSSQQYEMTKETGKYLRESVVCLVKNE